MGRGKPKDCEYSCWDRTVLEYDCAPIQLRPVNGLGYTIHLRPEQGRAADARV